MKLLKISSFLILFFSAVSVLANDYGKMVSDLNTLLETIRENENKIEELIVKKDQETDRNKIIETIGEITKIQKDLKQRYRALNELDEKVRYQYPEKLDETERLYKRYNLKSEEMKKRAMAMNARLAAIQAQAKKLYGPYKAPEKIQQEKSEEDRTLHPIIVTQ